MQISGTPKFIKWINTYNNEEKYDNTMISLDEDYDIHILVAEFNDIRYNYGITFYKDDKPILISYGYTCESYDGEYRSNISLYNTLIEKYNNSIFHHYETIINALIKTQKLKLIDLSLKDGIISLDYLNIMILAIILNNSIDSVITTNVDPKYIQLIKFFNDNANLDFKKIRIDNTLGSKLYLIENMVDFHHYDIIELKINRYLAFLITKNIVKSLPLLIDWIFIKLITTSSLNNDLLKSDSILPYVSNKVYGKKTEKNINLMKLQSIKNI